MVTEFEILTAFGRSIWLWTDLGLTNQIASFSLAIQKEHSMDLVYIRVKVLISAKHCDFRPLNDLKEY